MLIPLLALAMMQQPQPVPEHQRGSALYHDCLVAVALMDTTAPPGSNVDHMLAVAESNSCVEYISGFAEGVNIGVTDALKTEGSTLCVYGSSVATLTHVYVLYMKAHPTLMDQHRSIGLMLSLKEAFTCPK